MDIFEMACILQLFLRYTEMLQDLAFSVDPCAESHIWTLFGYRPYEHGTFWIPVGSLLYASSQVSLKASDNTSELGLILSGQDLLAEFQECVKRRLLDRVTRENDKCCTAPALNPCLDHVVYRNCDLNPSNCNGVHIFPDKNWFDTWTRVHLLQILIYHTIIHLQFRSEMKSQQRFGLHFQEGLETDVYFVEKGTGSGSYNKFLMRQTFGSGRIQTWMIRPLKTLGSH